jgi:hypothetical protein
MKGRGSLTSIVRLHQLCKIAEHLSSHRGSVVHGMHSMIAKHEGQVLSIQVEICLPL